MYSRIVAELAKRRYKRTVTQCRAKIKALKMRYKQMVDRLRRSGAGRESDEESDESSEFPYFALLDSVLGGRDSVTPVNLLDSADKPGTPSGAVPGEPTISRPETPAPIPGEPSVSRPNTPAAVLEPPVSMPDTPAAAPGESSVGRPDTPTAIPETPTTVEERRLQLDAKREERENERDRQFMATMSNMMMMMSQYMGTAFYPPMPMLHHLDHSLLQLCLHHMDHLSHHTSHHPGHLNHPKSLKAKMRVDILIVHALIYNLTPFIAYMC